MSAAPSELSEDAIEKAQQSAIDHLARCESSETLRGAVSQLTGKKGELGALKSRLGKVEDVSRRKSLGELLNRAAAEVSRYAETRLDELSAGEMKSRLERERWELTEISLGAQAKDRRGRLHPVTRATEILEDVFTGLGFGIAEGPEVETDFYNFEALNMPSSHPARSMWDTLFVETPEPGKVLLRTHTSPVQIRVMESQPPPIYAVMPGRVFRRDTPDATHMPVFHQIEGLVVDRHVTFAHLAGTIEMFTKAFFGTDFTSRLRPSYFPFTEPSAEFDIRNPDGEWLELGGGGMVHPRVLSSAGLDPEEWSGFAFGFGIDRMAMERHKIQDLRDMYSDDVRFIEGLS